MIPWSARAELASNVARIMREMAQDSERIGSQLATDPEVAGRHSAQLQKFDEFAQTLSELAKLLSANLSQEAVDHIRLEQLREDLLGNALEPVEGAGSRGETDAIF